MSEAKNENPTFQKQFHKQVKLLAKKKKQFNNIFKIKTKPINSSILIKKEKIKPKLEIQDSSLNLDPKNLSGLQSDTSNSDLDDDISLVNTTFFYLIVFLFFKLLIHSGLIIK